MNIYDIILAWETPYLQDIINISLVALDILI